MSEKSKKKTKVLDPREDYSKMKSVHLNSPVFFIVGLLYVLSTVWISRSVLESVPELQDAEVPFVGAEAWRDLNELNDIGPKVSGSKENEVIAANMIKDKIKKILKKKNQAQSAEFDHQIVSGSYYLNFKPYGQAVVYRSVQNLVVRLYGQAETRNAILLNCHFDSVFGSYGANDDIANCAIMLEILSILYSKDTPTRHDVIFLFNGAEEVGLRASHGFITQHKWAKDVKVLINLEAAGSGGKEILFQTGPGNSWLLNHYHAVRRPFAQVSSEEIFQSNLIPSDTDFRIFRDYGDVVGLDFAHIAKGYRYHTKYDHARFLSHAFVQRTGENILALTLSLSNGFELDNVEAFSKKDLAVYFDYLGIIFVHYTKEIGFIINFTVATLAIAIPFLSLIKATASSHKKYILKESFNGVFVIFAGTGVALLCCYLIGFYLDKSGHAMSWYRNTELVLGLYGALTILVLIFVNHLTDATFTNENSPLSLALRVQARLNGVSIWWAILTLGITVVGFRSGYLFMMILFFHLLTTLAIYLLKLQNSIRSWLYIHLLGQFFTMLWASYFFNVVIDVFIPIMGRSGSSKNPEMFISLAVSATTMFATSFMIPLSSLIKGKPLQFLTIILVFLTSIFLATSTHYGFPYQDDSTGNPTPQRHHVIHTTRTFYDIDGNMKLGDGGYMFLEWDRNSLKTIEGLTMPEQPLTLAQACNDEALCGFPIVQSRMLMMGMQWLPTKSRSKINNEAVIDGFSKFKVGDDLMKFIFTVNSTALTALYVHPRGENEMHSWSISEDFHELVNKTYFCSIANGLQDEIKPFKFDVTLKIKSSQNKEMIDVTLVTMDHNEQYFSKDFKKLVSRFPPWTFPVPLIAKVNAYTY